MRKLILLSSFLSVFFVSAQNKQVLYDFAELPQTLLLNPAVDFQGKFHIGVPGLSNLSFHTGFSGFSAYDLLADNDVDINDKIKNVYASFGKTEFMSFNQQMEFLNIGIRLKNNDYLSFGYYQELDVLFKFPKDMVDLFYDGNTVLDRRYSIDKLAGQAELLGVFHVGISRKVNELTRIGMRAKIYSSIASASTKQNSGSFYTENGSDNIYKQHLSNLDLLLETSGVTLPSNVEVDQAYIQRQFLFGGNLGIGLDIGFTYLPEEQWMVTGSIQDLGFIYYTKNVESYRVRGSYELEGFQLDFDPDAPDTYWKDLKDNFEDRIVTDTIHSNYMNFRPAKLNGSITYSFGRKRNDDCTFMNRVAPYTHKVGAHLFSRLNVVHSYVAATLFYERRFGKMLSTKITYTADPFSFANVGFGISARAGAFNVYAIADNLLGLRNVYDMQSSNVQLGMNFIFGAY
ncbi:MAG: hypothetical protein COB81_02515 [Flavobacteriaceae bacterium]|nr:MAG: hypothetical protein COB81_02515 [Flavobacteriaceae bacterium]